MEAWNRAGSKIFAVIPGRAEHEPGIHFTAHPAGKWIPGSRQVARPGMTAEGPVNSGEKANSLRILTERPYIHGRLALAADSGPNL